MNKNLSTNEEKSLSKEAEISPQLSQHLPQALNEKNKENRSEQINNKTHFGFETIDQQEKSSKVASVFHSVANRYDLMNDLMSGGMHRLWKAFTIAHANIKPGDKILDIASGTGDLAKAFAQKMGLNSDNAEKGEVWLSDINASMLRIGRDRLLNEGFIVPTLLCDAEKIPFPDHYFNIVTVAFGLRNMTNKEAALAEMHRVLKPGGKLLVLEFSKIWSPLSKAYNTYLFKVVPWLGKHIAKDTDSYRYLAESIQMHPDQNALKKIMEQAGIEGIEYYNLAGGVVALHSGTKY